MEATEIATEWLNDLTYTIATRDLNAHMRLVSKKVMVMGIGSKVIDYRGWMKRRRIEFEKQLLQRIKYSMPRIIDSDDNRITFSVTENIKASDGQVFELDKEVTLKQRRDGSWRVVLERINSINSE